jgi:fatty acid desaturase
MALIVVVLMLLLAKVNQLLEHPRFRILFQMPSVYAYAVEMFRTLLMGATSQLSMLANFVVVWITTLGHVLKMITHDWADPSQSNSVREDNVGVMLQRISCRQK